MGGLDFPMWARFAAKGRLVGFGSPFLWTHGTQTWSNVPPHREGQYNLPTGQLLHGSNRWTRAQWPSDDCGVGVVARLDAEGLRCSVVAAKHLR